MNNINSQESLKEFKEQLYSTNPMLKPEFIESITNVQAVLKRYYQPTYLIGGNEHIIYTDNFVDYIIEVGLKKASKFDLQHVFKSIISVYSTQLEDFLKDSNIANIYEYSANKSEPFEFDFDFNSGIVLRHQGKIIKKEFNDISKIEDRIKEIKQAKNLQEDMKVSNNLMKNLPSLTNILKSTKINTY